ncbi:hypothetical protein A2Z67_00080 [Candidatus Woesebacteria bacterium RBG_13_36_22]|uniref:HhH-GPD domain-containing protein n=1 Tax=Candidatus Woesebacteria bacterium RBG_13_36_22 TaxID=1802478 RepID=A0A1F7X8B7_9BACT|nr:MAG: hypothetical protein A2Z67_00080 [Candidatus Woesebacteria bacterium RBG_13_36_22]
MKITDEDKVYAVKVFSENFGRKKTDEEVFYEMCFCICAPQTTFKNNIKVINELRELDYYHLGIYAPGPLSNGTGKEWLGPILKPVRFYRNKAKWVAEAKQRFSEISGMVRSNWAWTVKRAWLVNYIHGFGMKTSSHFLRNLGARDLAIIDIHVLKYLKVEGKWDYEKLERKLRDIAKKNYLTVAELDIVIWKHYSKIPWEDYVR